MKKSVAVITFAIFILTSFTWADLEVEIEFRLQPDGSGMKTRNQGIQVDGDEVEIDLDGDEREVDSSKVDIDALVKLVTQTIKGFDMVEGKRIRAPYIEVKMEFSGEDREIEVSRRYPMGQLPAELVKLQENYLNEVWR